MKVSIIIPVYNAERYLQKCLDSVIGQTWKDIEVIIINDGSTDHSEAICAAYCSDPRVVYYYQKNSGVSCARNVGLSLATGEYICFVDSDDWLELDAIERLQNETADIVIYSFYHGDKKHKEPLLDGIYTKEALFQKMISYIDENGNIAYTFHNIWMRLFKREIIEENKIRFNTTYHNGEDLLFTFQATMKANCISVRCNEYLYHYRPVENSLTSSYIIDYWYLRKKIIEELYELLTPSDILYRQMPLRIFSWAVTAIKNELQYKKRPQKEVQKIVSDPVCDIFKDKIDVSMLNIENITYYKWICAKDVDSILAYNRQKKKLKKQKQIFRKFKSFIRKISII